MVTRMLDTQIRRERIPVNSEIAARLDIFCVSLTSIKNNQFPPKTESLRDGLAALGALFQRQDSDLGQSNWTGRITPTTYGIGGTLFVEDSVMKQQITICRDGNGALYNGIWMHYVSEQKLNGLLFEVTQIDNGYLLEMTDGSLACSYPLGKDLTGLTWAPPLEVEEIFPEEGMGNLNENPNLTKRLPAGQNAASLPQLPSPALPSIPVETHLSILLLIRQSDGRILAVKDRLTIGRGKENDLCLEDGEISRKHAVIEPIPTGWQIVDLDSTNGTLLNNIRILGAAPLKSGDKLEMGKFQFRLEISPKN